MPEELITLKGGHLTRDRRLDRIPYKDPKSREYPIRAVIGPRRPRSYTWNACDIVLDQGGEGACVGFGWALELGARPAPVPGIDDAFARRLYRRAQELDPFPGVEPEVSGSTVLAGAQAACELGFIREFRWAFGLDDVILALGYAGPVVLGINWYQSMYDPVGGELQLDGDVAGGHCIVARGVSVKARKILLRNSWGRDWGNGGDAWISFENLDRLLGAGGEACIPVIRRRKA